MHSQRWRGTPSGHPPYHSTNVHTKKQDYSNTTFKMKQRVTVVNRKKNNFDCIFISMATVIGDAMVLTVCDFYYCLI